VPAWKRWLGWSADHRGSLVVDAGAREAVVDGGCSLLAAGVVAVDGQFAAGDVVALTTGTGRPFARGLVNYPADELRRIVGLKTDRIATVLGSVPYEEVIHRDNLAIVSREDAAC
jgi:glutamate 5-kinase